MMSNLVLVDRQALLAELQQAFDTQTAKTLLSVLDKVAAQIQAAGAPREDFSQLKQIVTEIAEAQRQSELRFSEVEARFNRIETTLAALVEAQRQSGIRLGRVETRLDRLADKVAQIDGRSLEQAYREKADAYFGRLLRRPRVISLGSLWDSLETHLTADELDEVLVLDILVVGQPRRQANQGEVYLAIEVSAVIDKQDVERARRRAELLRQAGYQAIPVVAGESTTQGADTAVRQHNVVLLKDGSYVQWNEALQAWTN